MPSLEGEGLGPDLAVLASAVGSRLVRTVPITGLPSATLKRATFRLEFADGRILKGRRFDSPADAERVELLARVLGDCPLPLVWGRRGAALLEEWIPGVSLGRVAPRITDVRQAGALLGAMHGVPIALAGSGALPAVIVAAPSIDARRATTVRGLHGLVRLGLLTASAAHRLQALVDRHAPREASGALTPRGIIHRDFCRENLVLAPAGRLWVIDNGTLTVDAYDFDLGRTWYRWPLTPEWWSHFAKGYREHRTTDGFAEHFPFWAIAVLVEAALFRYEAATSDALKPVRRLDTLLGGLDAGDPRTWPSR